ncbi:MAG: zf-HC2 domain-containing protein [Archangiaceae bacterium]|nr:zf-HC2 domain-containing protein [Archangiaceae bacterium]
MNRHVSTHLVDLHTAGALSPEQLAQVKAHAATCETCAAKLSAAAKARDEFLARNPPALRAEALLGQARPHRSPMRWLVPAFALVAALLFAFVVLQRDDGLVLKGGPAVSAWVKRPATGRTWAPAPDEVLQAKDQLQLQVSPAGRSHVTVYALDAGGTFIKLFEQDVKGTATLEHSLTLDDSPGPDTLFVLFSEAALPELARAQVESAGESLQAGTATVAVRRWVVKKR